VPAQLGEAFNVPELNRPEPRRPQVTPFLLDLSLGDSQSASADRGWGGPNWPGALQGRHRRVVDAYEVNAGFPLAFAYTFSGPQQIGDSSRRSASWRLSIALGNAMWEKYKIGETLKIIDPETKASATKNLFLRPKAGVLVLDDMALDWLLERGVVFGPCSMALQVQSKMLAGNAGVTAEEAAKEWAANVIRASPSSHREPGA
jgi:hypothetical protein